MKKFTFGRPEALTPSRFCPTFNYAETPVKYDASRIKARENSRGYALTLPLAADEQIYGFGLQLKRLNWRGGKATLRVNADPVAATGDSHAPVPFFVSTAGYGIYFDTARYAEFNIGSALSGMTVSEGVDAATSTDDLYSARKPAGESVIAVQIPAAKGIDIYIIEGKSITDVVSQYNMLAGGGASVPEWGLGVFYRCFGRYTDKQVMAMADYFRDGDIPCSILGLEPGWQTHTYSCTYKWSDRFPDPDALIEYLGERGYHLNLWEHAFTHPDSPIYEKMAEGCGDFDVWGGHVPDFALDNIRSEFAAYHRENIIKGCLDGFKLDECDGSDYTGGWSFPNMTAFPSGLDGEQYHSLFGTLYMRTMLEALDGKPTLSEVRQAGALCSPYPFALYSDLYDHKDFIRGCVTSGFSGLLWAPEVRHANSAEDMLRRLQTVVFSPQCLINAWYCEEAPWIKLGCEDKVRETLKIRERLLPDLVRAFDEYHKNGLPPLRALVSDYTDDPETYNIDDQYIFCGNMIVAPMTAGQKSRSVYLPQGQWRDFFTGEKRGGGRFEVETENIPVYVKE